MDKKINIIFQNIQCLNHKKINCIENSVEKPQILCITEHWQCEKSLEVIKINKLSLASAFCRSVHKNGGSAIFLKSDILFKNRNDLVNLSNECNIEISAIETLESKMLVCSIYRPPNADNNIFYDSLEKLLISIENVDFPIFIGGDFNINVLKKDQNSNRLIDTFASFGFHNLINSPTRNGPTSATCIDNVFTRDNVSCNTHIINEFLSDHSGIKLIMSTDETSNIENKREKKRKPLNKQRTENLHCTLSNESWFNVYKTINAEEKCKIFLDTFLKHVDNIIPITEQKCKSEKASPKDEECIKMREHVKFCYSLKMCYPNNENFKTLYDTAKINYLNMLEKTRQNFNSEKIKNSDCKGKTVWAVINDSTNMKIKTQNTIDEIVDPTLDNNNKLNDPIEIANTFNKYFANVAADLKKKIPAAKNPRNLPQTNFSMYFDTITPLHIKQIISELKNSKSKDVYDISADIIKCCVDYIAEPLCDVFQACVDQGVFPSNLKISKTIPIFKKGKRSDPSNYRPIAILPILSKILEKLICKRLVDYVEKMLILCNSQHGFRKNKSTLSAIYDFLMNALECLDRGDVTAGIFIDLSKAFDTVNHEKLLKKLYSYGIRGNIHDLFRSYLKDRKQIVHIKTKNGYANSQPELINVGIPQGSILGPILYIIYTNDLPESVDDSVTMYADDTNVNINAPCAEDCAQSIINNIQSLENYFNDNELSMNLNKNKIIHFTLNNSKSNLAIHNTIVENTEMELANYANFLGVTLDSNLNFSEHINNLCNKLSKATFALRLVRKHCTLEAAKIAYYGYFQSNMNYGLLFWGSAPECYVNRVFILQKRALRGICQLAPDAPCRNLFILHRILTLPSLYILEILMFVKKNPHRFAQEKTASQYNLRNKDKLRAPNHNTTKFEKSPLFMGIMIYNKLPQSLLDECSYNKFRNTIKKILIQKAYYNINEFLNDKSPFNSI